MNPEPAWRCEFTAAGTSGATVRQAVNVTTPTRAMIWMRTSLRTLVSGLSPTERQAAYTWLDFGQWEAMATLHAGDPYTFRTTLHGMELAWTARRVLLLPLVPHIPQNENAPTGRS
ncbi:hypothetical protein GCM10010329_00470 [Streptomyces spiroverticillatus]|uniref:Uncharacterized protein n=1 Tax=Streptomyces finlayi TaxID=67296 RepID=A0A918WRX7_9ACTN|nr:hypothetical protein [Streptomyces finlayi]GGZ84922.1 hypothetical protein GCM10010329_00470 [Streptomyces spiroverticillatus]GHC76659.1 hypothetical protein GCM10010334_00470 [Streptomyces finlayi]